MNYSIKRFNKEILLIKKEVTVRMKIPFIVWQLHIRNPFKFIHTVLQLNQSSYIFSDEDIEKYK
jgi:hypothetical protein